MMWGWRGLKFLVLTPKAQSIEGETGMLAVTKNVRCAPRGLLLSGRKGKLQSGRECLQNAYLTEDQCQNT